MRMWCECECVLMNFLTHSPEPPKKCKRNVPKIFPQAFSSLAPLESLVNPFWTFFFCFFVGVWYMGDWWVYRKLYTSHACTCTQPDGFHLCLPSLRDWNSTTHSCVKRACTRWYTTYPHLKWTTWPYLCLTLHRVFIWRLWYARLVARDVSFYVIVVRSGVIPHWWWPSIEKVPACVWC